MACPALLHLALEAKTPSKADFFNAAYIKRLILGTRLPPRGAPTIGNNTSHAATTFQGPLGFIVEQFAYFRNVFGVPLALLFSPRSWDFWLLAFVCLLAFVLLAFVFSSLRSLLLAFVVCLLLAFVFCLRAFCLACVPCCSRSSFACCLRSFLLAFVFSLACVRCCSCPSFQRQGQRTGPRAKERRPQGHKASRTQRPGGLRGAP